MSSGLVISSLRATEARLSHHARSADKELTQADAGLGRVQHLRYAEARTARRCRSTGLVRFTVVEFARIDHSRLIHRA
jgi:hypothetical protein